MPGYLFAACAIAGFLAVGFLLGGALALRRVRWLAASARLTLALLLAALALLSGGLIAGTHGYRALTREDVAAVVHTDPVGSQAFRARFEFPDGTESSFLLEGDELYIDARILKWTPMANLLGLHTGYEFDRVSGRYMELEDEQARQRTVFSQRVSLRATRCASRPRACCSDRCRATSCNQPAAAGEAVPPSRAVGEACGQPAAHPRSWWRLDCSHA
jgi:hypothetical protein